MAASDLVLLRGGLAVTAEALHVLWRFEDAGFTLRVLGDGRLHVAPPHRITRGLAADIRAHRDELIALVRYTPDDSHLHADVPAAEPYRRTA